MSEIASYGDTASEDLATHLLGNGPIVRKLRHQSKGDNDAFVHKVFDTWLDQDDDDSICSTAPCTWEELSCCVKKTPDLPNRLAKDIRDQFLS